MKAIILYYSKSGVTEKLAKRIQSDLGCEMLKIEPEEAYGNYIQAVARVAKENRQKIIPKFKTELVDLSEYDLVLVGYPVWYQKAPVFVTDYLSKCDTANKKIVPFATFGGTGVNWTLKSLKAVCDDTTEILLPFDWGILKKDNYDDWIGEIHKLIE